MSTITSSFRKAITTSFDTVTDVMSAAQESVSMATTFVHHRAISQQIVDKDTVALATTLALEDIAVQLKGNAERQKLFDETVKLFN